MIKYFKFILPIFIPLGILVLPLDFFHIDHMTLIEQRVLSIFVMATLLWIFEPIPIYATSVLIICLELLMVSDQGLYLFRVENENLGELISYKSFIATFASPIIILFLGGFFLAMAGSKYHLDQNLARILLRPFGKKPKFVMLGLMMITAVFSMFMSNTATTAMMLSILTPVLVLFPEKDLGKIGLVLSIPVAANIGGIGTPIGTPPNAVAIKYLTGENAVSFAHWMEIGVPIAMIMLFIGWLLLTYLFPSNIKEIKLNIQGHFLTTPKAILVYITFSGTILLWLTGGIHGMNSYVVAIIPVAVFSVFQIISKEDLKKISWDVLWLVSGGIALGVGLEKSGLAQNFVSSIPFIEFHPLIVISGISILCLLMANFMSNTATANLILPIVAALAISMHTLLPYGGQLVIILATTFATSFGMSLPVSTPPNSLAYSTGLIETKHMVKVGIVLGAIGILVIYAMLFLFTSMGLFL